MELIIASVVITLLLTLCIYLSFSHARLLKEIGYSGKKKRDEITFCQGYNLAVINILTVLLSKKNMNRLQTLGALRIINDFPIIDEQNIIFILHHSEDKIYTKRLPVINGKRMPVTHKCADCLNAFHQHDSPRYPEVEGCFQCPYCNSPKTMEL